MVGGWGEIYVFSLRSSTSHFGYPQRQLVTFGLNQFMSSGIPQDPPSRIPGGYAISKGKGDVM